MKKLKTYVMTAGGFGLVAAGVLSVTAPPASARYCLPVMPPLGCYYEPSGPCNSLGCGEGIRWVLYRQESGALCQASYCEPLGYF